jgi:hypothetical protein
LQSRFAELEIGKPPSAAAYQNRLYINNFSECILKHFVKMLWLILALGLVTGLYFWCSKKLNYFKSKGVSYEPGYFPLGSKNNWKVLTGQ